MKRVYVLAVATLVTISFYVVGARSDGNPERDQRIFGACAACHSLQPDQNMTGPSLADLWNRKAGSVANFNRYSSALQSSNIVWNDKTLDEWINDPQHVVPDNQMAFAGIKDARERADLLAFLKRATQKGGLQAAQQGGPMGGMMGGGGVLISRNLIRQTACRQSPTAKILTPSQPQTDRRASFGSAIFA